MRQHRHSRRWPKLLGVGAVLAVIAVAGIATGLRSVDSKPSSPPAVLPFTESAARVPAPRVQLAQRTGATGIAREMTADASDLSRLRMRGLVIPVTGISALQLNDNYTQARAGGASHEALDIMATRGTDVLAVEDGRIAKLFLSKPGGITLYQFDPTGEYAYYYAHLDSYAEGITEGGVLRKGQIIGYVGSSGNASPNAPHLHFAIFKLGAEKQWWRGTPINPFLVWRNAKP